MCTFLKVLFYLFLERREGREKGRQRKINVWEKLWLVSSHIPQLGTWPATQGMCPDWEWNPWSFCLHDDTQNTEPHQSEQNCILLNTFFSYMMIIHSFIHLFILLLMEVEVRSISFFSDFFDTIHLFSSFILHVVHNMPSQMLLKCKLLNFQANINRTVQNINVLSF